MFQKVNHNFTNFTVHYLGDDLSMERKKNPFSFDKDYLDVKEIWLWHL